MKTLYLAMIVFASSVLVLSNWSQVEGRIVPQTILQLYKESDVILVGNVTSVETSSSGIYTLYHIKVEQYLKSIQPNDTITAVGSGPNGGHPPPDPHFIVGDRVRFYLNKENGMNMISMYSTTANPKCYAHELLGLGPHESVPRGGYDSNYSTINCGAPFQFTSYPHTTFLPPMIQFQSGVKATDIACDNDLQLIFKTEDGSPACVKPATAQKLVEYGWKHIAGSPNSTESSISNSSTIPVKFYNGMNTGYSINYTINGGKITGAKINLETQSLTLATNMTNNGHLTLNLPRGILDFKHNYWENGNITVNVDGNKTNYDYAKSNGDWVLNMELKEGATKIEIIPFVTGLVEQQK